MKFSRNIQVNRGRSRAFTLVELLVVIGIIAVLISILLPALTKARESANNVKCMSNMRQIFIATRLYANSYKNYILPSRVGSSASKQYWCGTEMLAPFFNIKVITNASGTPTQDSINAVGHFLVCPSNTDRPKDLGSGSRLSVDYTYNGNLGDERAYSWSSAYDPNYTAWATFKQVTKVPSNVIILADAGPLVVDNDERFMSVDDLTFKYRRVGIPHNKQANFLFNDGTVHKLDPWAKNMVKPYLQALPMVPSASNPVKNPLLDAFMVDSRKWAKGRPPLF